MRRPLNLNGVASKILGVISLFLIGLPLLLVLLSQPFLPLHLSGEVAQTWILVSLIIGALLFAGFAILVIVEQIQDARYERWYRQFRGHRLRLPDGSYECQYCGSRKLKEDDKACPACGKELV